MNRTRTRLLAAGFALALVAAVIGWALYVREKNRADTLAAEVASMEPDVAVVRQYNDESKIARAKEEMRAIERAYKNYYLEHAEWPSNIRQIARSLEEGQKGLIDPWGQPYTVQIEEYIGSDGLMRERPVVYYQPPGDRPRVRWPEK